MQCPYLSVFLSVSPYVRASQGKKSTIPSYDVHAICYNNWPWLITILYTIFVIESSLDYFWLTNPSKKYNFSRVCWT